MFFFCSSRRRHTRWPRDWSSDVCSSDLLGCGADDLAAVTQLFESGHGCLDAPDNTVEVDGKQFLDAFLCDVLDWRCRSEERRVGKEGRDVCWRDSCKEEHAHEERSTVQV